MSFVCPHCNKIVHTMPHSGDVVHECDTGDDYLDKEDRLAITGANWNTQGIINVTDPIDRIRGNDEEPLNEFGNRKSTHFKKDRERYFKLD